MTFTVHASSSAPLQYGDNDQFEIIEGGVLKTPAKTDHGNTSAPTYGKASTRHRDHRQQLRA
jgi:hypothetical protein